MIKRTKEYYNDRAKQMIQMYEEGLSLKSIGEHFGVTKQMVSLALRNRGYLPKELQTHVTKAVKAMCANKQLVLRYDKLKEMYNVERLKAHNYETMIKSRDIKIQKLKEELLELRKVKKQGKSDYKYLFDNYVKVLSELCDLKIEICKYSLEEGEQ